MIEFFKPEDFRVNSEIGMLSIVAAAALANEKLNAALGAKIYASHLPGWSLKPSEFDTHEAWIFNTQEIKKEPCKHEKVKISEAWLNSNLYIQNETSFFKCIDCGKLLKPVWEEVK